MNKKRISSLIALLNLPLLFVIAIGAKSADIYNESDTPLPGKTVYIHGVSGLCSDIWHPDTLDPKTGHYHEGIGWKQAACCYDWFKVYDDKFYIPNSCRGAGPTITIKNDGVYVNGDPANHYGDVGAFFKQLGQKIEAKSTGFAQTVADLAVKSWENLKKAANQFKGFMEEGADETKDFAKMVYEKGLKPVGEKIKQYGDIVVTMVKNWTKGRPHHDYCDLSKVVLLDPPLIDSKEALDQDTEGLIPYIKKYSPVAWLQEAEDYYPMRFSEYLTAPGTSIISRKNEEVIVPKGQVTLQKMYEMHKDSAKYKDKELAFDVADCTWFGSNPAPFTDKAGNLTVPAYVVTFEQEGKIYIQYIYFYGLNGPYDIGPFKGNVIEIQNFHRSDAEHLTLELDKTTKELKRIYYSSHGPTEGFWLDAKHPDVEFEGTHPVIYVAHYGHGNYPKEGTYVRIFGMANDVTGQGQKWTPQLIRIYPETDKRFDPKTMGFMYFPGTYGREGVGPIGQQSWFANSVNTQKPASAGDRGRSYSPNKWFCKNPPHRDTKNPIEALKVVGDEAEYAACITTSIPYATIPD